MSQDEAVHQLQLDHSDAMLFPGDSAELSERVVQANLEAALLSSSSSLSQHSDVGDGGTGQRSFGKSQSQQTAELISKAKRGSRKQVILDAYMDKKILTSETPEANAARLSQKLARLSAHLAPEDSRHALQRGQYYVQHMSSLCHQKLKRTTFVSGSSAARVAHSVERQANAQKGLCIIMSHMQEALCERQGPNAKQGAMQTACTDVLEALAFPQPPEWQAELKLFIDKGTKAASMHPPGYRCKKTACKLNMSPSPTARDVAESYFYDKIVTHWNVGANQGHIEDKLQSLLPLVINHAIRQEVCAAAEACRHNMEHLRSKKKADESSRHQMRHRAAHTT